MAFRMIALWAGALLVLGAGVGMLVASAAVSDEVNRYYFEQSRNVDPDTGSLDTDPGAELRIQRLSELQWMLLQLAGPVFGAGIVGALGALGVHAYRWDRA